MNNKLMREGLTKFIASLELDISKNAGEKRIDSLEKLWSEVLLSGYTQDPWSALSTRQAAVSSDPVYINKIPFVSICQDHLLPFSGFVTIGYIPGKEFVGLSNIGKLVHILSARLHVQENLTSEIADVLYKTISPVAVAVCVVAQHNCKNIHGHNWKIEVVMQSLNLDNIGMAIDFRRLKQETQGLLDTLDHTYINENPPFNSINPTAENKARWLYESLSKKLNDQNARVSRVNVWENENSSASFFE